MFFLGVTPHMYVCSLSGIRHNTELLRAFYHCLGKRFFMVLALPQIVDSKLKLYKLCVLAYMVATFMMNFLGIIMRLCVCVCVVKVLY